jgi:hypothetical protein
MKKVISFSLWGKKPEYTIGALKNASLAETIYPGWICRFYTGKNVDKCVMLELMERDNTEIFIMNEEGNWSGMFWRFSIASDPTVDIAIVRDTDSRLSQREKWAVDAWLDSGKPFHIMRDHPYHKIEIPGGMWGACKGAVPDMYKLIKEYEKGDFWQVDQNFLREKVYDKIKDIAYVHDNFFEKRPFPYSRKPGEFVGQQFTENDIVMHPEHINYL